jgi:cell division septation protein DedD
MQYRGRSALAGAAAILMAFAAAPALADVKTGVDAWQRGDFAAAIREWRPLADKGNPDAQFNMGQAYRLGRGVPVDMKIAASWYQKAAAQGHEQAQANHGVILYESGKRAESMSWIRKAAARGDARAQYILGVELSNGDLLKRDFAQAYGFMTRAASQGLPAAGKALAEMDKFIPLADRQKGLGFAQQIASPPAAPRVAANLPAIAAPAAVPRTNPVAPAAAKPKTAPAAPPVAAAPVAVAGRGWRAQLGAYGSPAAAQAQWAVLRGKLGAYSGLQPSYEKAGNFTRLRLGPLANKAAVDRLCAAARAAGQACFPVAP